MTKDEFTDLVGIEYADEYDKAQLSQEGTTKDATSDLISKQAVSSWLKQYGQDVLHGKYKFSLMYIWKNLMDLPSAQPERKKGQWIVNVEKENTISGSCSACGWQAHLYEDDVVGMDFCPNCGANMEE